MRRQSFAQFETAEEKGAISIGSLRRAAGAMDCELIYFVVPRGPAVRSFAEHARLRDPAQRHLRATEHSMRLREPGPRDDVR